MIYKKMKKIHNKNSTLIGSYLKNVGSSEKIKRIKFQRNSNSNSNSHYKGISDFLNRKVLFKKMLKKDNIY
jgi:hypothetical protein